MKIIIDFEHKTAEYWNVFAFLVAHYTPVQLEKWELLQKIAEDEYEVFTGNTVSSSNNRSDV